VSAPHTHPLDVVDTDPTRLAARTLVERLRATIYNTDGDPPQTRSWWRYALDDQDAVAAVLHFAHDAVARRERQRATQKQKQS